MRYVSSCSSGHPTHYLYRWMIKICDTWSFEQLSALDEEMMERLLDEGWERDLRVPTYEELGGKMPYVK